jgi:signal transduction histidine kinase
MKISRKGHGLGLAGALILARSLGGDIALKSKQGQGATFILILPLMLET